MTICRYEYREEFYEIYDREGMGAVFALLQMELQTVDRAYTVSGTTPYILKRKNKTW